MRIFLGILEFLVLSQMDLPDSLRRFLEDFRNAGIGLPRMPVLGYLGYLPFALELFGLYHLVTGFFPGMGKRDYLQIIPVHEDSP